MGLLGLGKKKKAELTAEERCRNALWERWANGEAPSPLAEVMTYQSEVNNGGHDQYFFNVSNTDDLRKALAVLEEALPEVHARNLKRAYGAYLALEKQENTEQAEAILEQCDAVFYEQEEEIDSILKMYAAQIEL